MYCLVKFGNDEYYITSSKKLKIVEDRECRVKYKSGAVYSAILIEKKGK